MHLIRIRIQKTSVNYANQVIHLTIVIFQPWIYSFITVTAQLLQEMEAAENHMVLYLLLGSCERYIYIYIYIYI